jgi:mevalonate kinase
MPGDFMSYFNNPLALKIIPYLWPKSLFPVLIFTGESASTKDLVKKVLDYKNANLNEYVDFMKRYNSANLQAKLAFEKSSLHDIKNCLEESWSMRKKLGVMAGADIESGEYTRLITELKKNGAFTAGLIGAGGGDSILALCREEDDKKRLLAFLDPGNMHYLDGISLVSKPYRW